MASSIRPTYLIIGGGVFGASTALHLAKKHLPPTGTEDRIRIILVDRPILPYQKPASQDQSRVIRADYPHPLYTQLALEAKSLWRSDPLYNEFYHETGLIWADMNKTDFAKDAIANYRNLGIADLGNLDEICLNESSGWAEAKKTLQKVINAAVSTGVVKHIEAEIARLIFNADGSICIGARTVDGQDITADFVILATGAETAKLLAKSAPEFPDLHVGSRMAAAGLITGVLRLDQEEADQLRSAPVFLFAGGKAQGAIIPPTAENELKITCDISFMNMVKVIDDTYIPPEDPVSTYSNLSTEMNRALITVSESILGEGTRNSHFEDCRICWDVITPDQDFIISPHPHYTKLFIATGGSFHAWKFFPTLGKYVVQMLEDKLDHGLAQRWFWDRDSASAANERMMPVREMKDLESRQVFSSQV